MKGGDRSIWLRFGEDLESVTSLSPSTGGFLLMLGTAYELKFDSPKEVALNSSLGRIALTIAAAVLLAVFASAGALADTVSRSVTLGSGAAKQTISLAPVSKMTVYSVSVLSPKKLKVTVDLRSKSGSISYPGIFATPKGQQQLSIYTYRPIGPGRYSVVLQKKTGSPAKVTVKVTSKLAAKPKKAH